MRRCHLSGGDATAPVPLSALAALQRAAQTPRCAGAAFQRASARRSISCDAQVPPPAATVLLRGAQDACDAQVPLPRAANGGDAASRRCRPQRRRHYEAPPISRDAQVPPSTAASQVCAALFLRCAGAAFSGGEATAPVPLSALAALQRAAQTPRCAGAAFQRQRR